MKHIARKWMAIAMAIALVFGCALADADAEAGSTPVVVDAQNFAETVVMDGEQCRLTITSPGTIEGDLLWWGIRLENTADEPLTYFWQYWETYVNDEMIVLELYDANGEDMDGETFELEPGETFEGKIELYWYDFVRVGIRDVEEVGLSLETRLENKHGDLECTYYRGAFAYSPALSVIDDSYAEELGYLNSESTYEGLSGKSVLLDDENCFVKVLGCRNYHGGFDMYATFENRSDATLDVDLTNIHLNGVSVDPDESYAPNIRAILAAGKRISAVSLSLDAEELEPFGISEVTDVEGKLWVSWAYPDPERGELGRYSVPVELHLGDADSAAASADDTDDATVAEIADEEPVEITEKEQIRIVQEMLNQLGYDCGTPDGIAGKKTQAAVTQFQRDSGLTETGTINAETIAKLEEALA